MLFLTLSLPPLLTLLTDPLITPSVTPAAWINRTCICRFCFRYESTRDAPHLKIKTVTLIWRHMFVFFKGPKWFMIDMVVRSQRYFLLASPDGHWMLGRIWGIEVELACSLPHLTWDDACACFLNCRALCCTRLHCNLFFLRFHIRTKKQEIKMFGFLWLCRKKIYYFERSLAPKNLKCLWRSKLCVCFKHKISNIVYAWRI